MTSRFEIQNGNPTCDFCKLSAVQRDASLEPDMDDDHGWLELKDGTIACPDCAAEVMYDHPDTPTQ